MNFMFDSGRRGSLDQRRNTRGRFSTRGIVIGCAAILLAMPFAASAFESDVHFGLTAWLARQGGYTPDQATAIATGDQRVDAGDVQFTDLMSIYACAAPDAKASELVRTHHFPSAKGVPNPPADRVVEAGSASARQLLDVVLRAAPGRESYLLYKLGEAVHVLQDSWSNQGVPSVPDVFPAWFGCDAALTWGEPLARGGWASHRPDQTSPWTADVMAMAAATYEALGRYPAGDGARRAAKPWPEVAAQLDGFVRATTKSAKADWFVAHGIDDVSFLDGITLADGARPFTATWNGRHLPPLATFASSQHDIDPQLLQFFDDFLGRWIAGGDLKGLASASAVPASARERAAGPDAPIDAKQLLARLALWRIRDHGSVADLAHQAQPLSVSQLGAVDKAAAKAGALTKVESAARGVLPLLPDSSAATPLLPYWTRHIDAEAGAPERAVATFKFRHAPYDTVEVFAIRTAQGWKVAAIRALVEH
jgi:hypothetical protein